MILVVLDAETLGFGDEAWSALAELGDLRIYGATEGAEQTIERCREATIVLTNKVAFDRQVLEALPALRCISTLATGYNVVDVDTAREQGVVVCNVPAYSTDAVAQHTLAMILEWTNRIGLHADSVRAGDWIRSKHFSYHLCPIPELSDLTVGLVGFGDIGRRVGGLLHAIGATILASMRTPRNPPEWERFSFAETDEIFARSDIVSLHCPLTDANAGMVDAARLQSMRPHALLVNTARGGLVVEEDLAQALNSEQIGGAMLDVVTAEPMRADNPLRTARNCWITPHIAWASERARRRLIAESVVNVAAFQKGHPRNVVS